MSLDDRTRGNIDKTGDAILDPLTRQFALDLIGGKSAFTIKQVFQKRLWVVPTHSILGDFEPSKYAQILAKFFFLRECLSRKINDESAAFALVHDEYHLTSTNYDAQAFTVGRSQLLCPCVITQGVNPLRANTGDADRGVLQANTILQTLGIKVACTNFCTDTNEWHSKLCSSRMVAVASGNWDTASGKDFNPLFPEESRMSSGYHMQLQPYVYPVEFTRLKSACLQTGGCETIVHGIPGDDGLPFRRVFWPMRIRS
jgi:hypothetical protein